MPNIICADIIYDLSVRIAMYNKRKNSTQFFLSKEAISQLKTMQNDELCFFLKDQFVFFFTERDEFVEMRGNCIKNMFIIFYFFLQIIIYK